MGPRQVLPNQVFYVGLPPEAEENRCGDNYGTEAYLRALGSALYNPVVTVLR